MAATPAELQRITPTEKQCLENKRALKRIRKLSDWLKRQQQYRASSMRKQLMDLVAGRHETA